MWQGSKTLVTGGAGFIGSHLVDELVRQGSDVIIYDNLSTGQEFNVTRHPEVQFIKGDILDEALLTQSMEGVDVVFHMAANADVRGGMANTHIDLTQNVIGTHRVLEAMKHHQVKKIVFASSSAVYGEPEQFPTPEEYVCLQTSVYGASKMAAEGYIQAYCEYFDMQSFLFRFVSWIGERYTHGVIYDFVKKLKTNPHQLEILGDGKQKKSYLDVTDGVRGIFLAAERLKTSKNVLNLGHEDSLDVTALANIVVEEMGLSDVEYIYTGGIRGWKGDSPFVLLDTQKMKAIGWNAAISIEDSIRRTVRYLQTHFNQIHR